MRTNAYGQPIGPDLDGWSAPDLPTASTITGRYVSLEPYEAQHAEGLAAAFAGAPESLWTYLPYGPFTTSDEFSALLASFDALPDWQPYTALVDGVVVGFLCYLRIDPPIGSIEVGAVTFSPLLQRSPASTEAQFLLLRRAFESGYRRYEWKCDSLNEPSREAAARLGFTFEGIFRKATHYKGRSRDTAWLSITDDEWPAIRAGFEQWLDPSNFGADGTQDRSLVECRTSAGHRTDPRP